MERNVNLVKKKTILLRGYSEESNMAEKILKDENIDYVQLFSTEEDRAPLVISPNCAYAYEGIGSIQLFVRSAKKTK